MGERVPERDRRRPAARARRCFAAGSRIPPWPSRERAFLAALRAGFTELVSAEQRLYVGGAADLLGEVRGDELEAYRSLFELVEKRAALLEVLGDATYRPAPARSSASATISTIQRCTEIALVGACYGLVHRALGAVSLVGPVRMDYEKAVGASGPRRPSSRASPSRVYSRALASTTMATTERDYYELLGVARGADEAEIKKAFRRLARELHPDVSDEPDAEERFREVVEAYEVLSKSETRELYDRYGHAGLRSGGFQPGHFDFGNLSDLFSAFFGDDLIGGAPAGARSRPRRRRSRSSSSRRRTARARGPVRGRRRVRALRRQRRRARRPR